MCYLEYKEYYRLLLDLIEFESFVCERIIENPKNYLSSFQKFEVNYKNHSYDS